MVTALIISLLFNVFLTLYILWSNKNENGSNTLVDTVAGDIAGDVDYLARAKSALQNAYSILDDYNKTQHDEDGK